MNFQFSSKSVAEETGLNLTLSETPKTGFVALRPIYVHLSEPWLLTDVKSTKMSFADSYLFLLK